MKVNGGKFSLNKNVFVIFIISKYNELSRLKNLQIDVSDLSIHFDINISSFSSKMSITSFYLH